MTRALVVFSAAMNEAIILYMKNYILLFSLTLSGCALYQDFENKEFNWMGSGKPKPQKTVPGFFTEKNTDGSEELVPSVPYEEMISRNWEYSKRKDAISNVTTFEATTASSDKALIMTIVKNNKNESAIILTLKQGEVSYRDGHSVEMILDGETLLQMVHPSEEKSSREVKLVDGKKVCQLLQDKKDLIFELNINGVGNKKFHFDISGLQKFFTII
jgi:hypothetical protein